MSTGADCVYIKIDGTDAETARRVVQTLMRLSDERAADIVWQMVQKEDSSVSLVSRTDTVIKAAVGSVLYTLVKQGLPDKWAVVRRDPWSRRRAMKTILLSEAGVLQLRGVPWLRPATLDEIEYLFEPVMPDHVDMHRAEWEKLKHDSVTGTSYVPATILQGCPEGVQALVEGKVRVDSLKIADGE